MTPRIERAIDTLLEALKNRTLAAGDACACAVGNLVAKGIGAEITKNKNGALICTKPNEDWYVLVSRLTPNLGTESEAFKQVRSTGFTIEELWEIERAFEAHTMIGDISYINHTDREILEDQIRGLDAVIKVMLEFDDCKETVREVFTDEAEKVLVGC